MHKNQANATKKYREAHNIRSFSTYMNGYLLEEMRAFLKEHNKTNVDIVVAGYEALKERCKKE